MQSILGRYVYNNRFLDVEYSLFPMGIFCMRTGAESNGFMTRFKANVEPCYKSMNEVFSCGAEFKIGDEGEIRDRASVKV